MNGDSQPEHPVSEISAERDDAPGDEESEGEPGSLPLMCIRRAHGLSGEQYGADRRCRQGEGKLVLRKVSLQLLGELRPDQVWRAEIRPQHAEDRHEAQESGPGRCLSQECGRGLEQRDLARAPAAPGLWGIGESGQEDRRGHEAEEGPVDDGTHAQQERGREHGASIPQRERDGRGEEDASSQQIVLVRLWSEEPGDERGGSDPDGHDRQLPGRAAKACGDERAGGQADGGGRQGRQDGGNQEQGDSGDAVEQCGDGDESGSLRIAEHGRRNGVLETRDADALGERRSPEILRRVPTHRHGETLGAIDPQKERHHHQGDRPGQGQCPDPDDDRALARAVARLARCSGLGSGCSLHIGWRIWWWGRVTIHRGKPRSSSPVPTIGFRRRGDDAAPDRRRPRWKARDGAASPCIWGAPFRCS
jgi:hypothetical protein